MAQRRPIIVGGGAAPSSSSTAPTPAGKTRGSSMRGTCTRTFSEEELGRGPEQICHHHLPSSRSEPRHSQTKRERTSVSRERGRRKPAPPRQRPSPPSMSEIITWRQHSIVVRTGGRMSGNVGESQPGASMDSIIFGMHLRDKKKRRGISDSCEHGFINVRGGSAHLERFERHVRGGGGAEATLVAIACHTTPPPS
eukprot:COSAG01_NODE_28785_length_652_cov_56.043400_1_plen_196_part_00